jgi:hypothetical protein
VVIPGVFFCWQSLKIGVYEQNCANQAFGLGAIVNAF